MCAKNYRWLALINVMGKSWLAEKMGQLNAVYTVYFKWGRPWQNEAIIYIDHGTATRSSPGFLQTRFLSCRINPLIHRWEAEKCFMGIASLKRCLNSLFSQPIHLCHRSGLSPLVTVAVALVHPWSPRKGPEFGTVFPPCEHPLFIQVIHVVFQYYSRSIC